jgi:hypothetical protein
MVNAGNGCGFVVCSDLSPKTGVVSGRPVPKLKVNGCVAEAYKGLTATELGSLPGEAPMPSEKRMATRRS